MRKITLALILMFLINTFTVQATGEYIEEEIFIRWDYGLTLDTDFVHTGGIIFLNITLLLASQSNVSLTFADDERITWTPTPPDNFTLNQNENYSQTFTLEGSGVDNHGNIRFACSVLQENSNATILWGYNIINKGTDAVSIGIEPITIGLLAFSIGLYLYNRKK